MRLSLNCHMSLWLPLVSIVKNKLCFFRALQILSVTDSNNITKGIARTEARDTFSHHSWSLELCEVCSMSFIVSIFSIKVDETVNLCLLLVSATVRYTFTVTYHSNKFRFRRRNRIAFWLFFLFYVLPPYTRLTCLATFLLSQGFSRKRQLGPRIVASMNIQF